MAAESAVPAAPVPPPPELQRSRGVMAAERERTEVERSSRSPLQRSRGVMAAESGPANAITTPNLLLQRSRGVMAAESVVLASYFLS